MLNSHIEIIAQGQHYLETVSSADYNDVIKPLFISSAGAHIRHVIDHYLAVKSSSAVGVINYNHRARGTDIETDPQKALQAFSDILRWLKTLTSSDYNQALLLTTEIAVSQKETVTIPTTLARELIFVSSHAVHHFAMIAQIAKAQTKELPKYFGIAPATATFIRENNESR